MASAVYCGDCGIRNNPSHMNCKMCNSKLPMPARQNPLYAKLTQDRPKAVVFDLDMTLFDNSQRFTDARRAGLVDKAGKPKVKGMMSKRQAFNKRNKFLYSNKELAKDVVIPGATQLVSDLKNDGYTIIYLTARPEKYQEQTIQQLESNGFPLFRDTDGNSLVFSKPADKTQVPAFKGNKVRELLGNYKIEMVFDDNKSNLEEIAKLGIPGLYASLSDHVKHNPHNKYGGQNTFTSDPDDDVDRIDDDDDDNKIYGVVRTLRDNNNPMGPKPNPANMREEVRKLLDKEDPRWDKNMPRSGDMASFISLGPMRYDAHPDGLMSAIFSLKNSERYGSVVPIPHSQIKMAYEEGFNKSTDYINEDDRPLLESTIDGYSNTDLPNPLPKPKKKKLSNGKYRKEPKKTYVNRMMETKKMKEDFPDRKQRFAVTMTLVERFYGKSKATPKSNPAHPSKVEKAKKLYKHMNGKEPAKIEKKKLDLGDVWYQVGEGGCWQIGYISGKDNGRDDQKYTHVFNEETKDGNFPKLYATMPENGKPMLIITGGTWKIKTDATGTAWIYD